MHSEKAEKVSYYNTLTVEAVDFIEMLQLPFSLGNAIKYIFRCNNKDPKKEDMIGELNKILYYIGRERDKFMYNITPSPVHDGVIMHLLFEVKEQLDPKLWKGLYWILMYIRSNKVTELKSSKLGYLDRAMQNIAEYRDELEKKTT